MSDLPKHLHYCCPFDGRKFRKAEAMADATINIRRTCTVCKRQFSITIKPIRIEGGWAHSATITVMQ